MKTSVLVFDLLFLLTLAGLSLSAGHYYRLFRFLRPAFPVRDLPARLWNTVRVGLAQARLFRRPFAGMLHALLFWSFLVILAGTLEMILDGFTGREKSFAVWGGYPLLTAMIDVAAPLVALIVVIFFLRRNLFVVPRFRGREMGPHARRDANITLLLILLLMVTLTGMDLFYLAAGGTAGRYPVAERLLPLLGAHGDALASTGYRLCWWSHIVIIFLFANYLPWSKHFHVYLSLPNVFLSRPWPVGALPDMPQVTREVEAMLRDEPPGDEPPGRFGILDAEDLTRKEYLESLTCTQCGRCTEVCPVHRAGGPLSPRKVMMETRARMDEKGPLLLRGDDDGRPLLGARLTDEEIFACTMCYACAEECPLTIRQPELILGMRRYRILEEGAAPPEWNSVYSHVENNGALWQKPAGSRLEWARDLRLRRDGRDEPVEVPVMADRATAGNPPDMLLWTGSAGSYDPRYRRVLQDLARILAWAGIDYAVLGEEEISSGDMARRTGNEMLFVMQAKQNIETFRRYGITTILTCDPHVYNTFRNEYPSFGPMPEVIHHTRFLERLMEEGRLPLPATLSQRVTYHDPCYLGRLNGGYEAPRRVLRTLGLTVREMEHNRSRALCCGGGGGQMFREEQGQEEKIFVIRTREALATGARTIVTACPYCMTMLTDGVKYEHAEEECQVKDVAEMVAEALGLHPPAKG